MKSIFLKKYFGASSKVFSFIKLVLLNPNLFGIQYTLTIQNGSTWIIGNQLWRTTADHLVVKRGQEK